jgi:hypothetical protein
MMTPAEGVETLLKAQRRVELANIELEAAKLEVRELQETILPPIFVQARMITFEGMNGVKAKKDLFSYARLPKQDPDEDSPESKQRKAMIDWLVAVGQKDAIKGTLVAQWGRGEYEQAQAEYLRLKQLESAAVFLTETVHWRTLENIVLAEVKRGTVVPLEEIGARVGDRVTITRNPSEPA